MIRQPPAYVPNPIAVAASSTTQSGGDGNCLSTGGKHACADQREGDHPHRLLRVIGPVRKRHERPGRDLSQAKASVHGTWLGVAEHVEGEDGEQRTPNTSPMSGEATSAMTTGITDPHFTASTPYATTPIPMSAPISACDELDGNPKRQVMRFQTIAPTSAAMIMPSDTPCFGADQSSDCVGDVRVQDLDGDQRAEKVERRRQRDRRARPERTRADRRRHRVRCVMESVGEVESQRDHHGRDQQRSTPVTRS